MRKNLKGKEVSQAPRRWPNARRLISGLVTLDSINSVLKFCSEHPDSIAGALLVLGTEKRIPPITMEQVSNATNLNIGTIRRVRKMLHDLHRGSLFSEDGAGAEVAGAEAEVAGLRLRYRLEQGLRLRFRLEQGLERRKEQGRKSIEFLSWMQKEGAGEEEH